MYRVISAAAATASLNFDPEDPQILHTFEPGDLTTATEVGTTTDGQRRAFTQQGWVSFVSQNGDKLLEDAEAGSGRVAIESGQTEGTVVRLGNLATVAELADPAERADILADVRSEVISPSPSCPPVSPPCRGCPCDNDMPDCLAAAQCVSVAGCAVLDLTVEEATAHIRVVFASKAGAASAIADLNGRAFGAHCYRHRCRYHHHLYSPPCIKPCGRQRWSCV